jgi:3-hydroxyisobutyrate dehydrogenase
MMDKSMTKLAFLGFGVMGYPMAGHLAKAGHAVTVYNRTTAKAETWAAEHGGSFGKTPAQAAQGAEIVMACVGNDDDLRAVCLGPDGAFATMSEGSTFVDHTTVSAAVTAELYGHRQRPGDRVCRCTRVRRPGGRQQRRIVDHVWRRSARF